MTGYKATRISPPADETDFEKKTVILFRELLKDPNVKRVGRRGQGQKGVDVIGRRNATAKHLVGIQCKVKGLGKALSEDEARHEVKKALTYRPKLKEYFIVTTAPNNIALDQLA